MESMSREQLLELLKALNGKLPKATGAQKADLDGLVNAIFGQDYPTAQTAERILLYSRYMQVFIK